MLFCLSCEYFKCLVVKDKEDGEEGEDGEDGEDDEDGEVKFGLRPGSIVSYVICVL